MRGDATACRVHTPGDLAEALVYLAEHPEVRPLAGGTDLMVPYAAGRLADTHFLNLARLSELRGMTWTEDHLVLGALTTFSEVRAENRLLRTFPNLGRSAESTGGVAIQNRGTLGGNVMNASPAADTPPSLLAYGAEVALASLRGQRWVPYADFHTGYKRTLKAPDELLTALRLPLPSPGGLHFFRKVGTRKAQAIAKVALAAHGRLEEGCLVELRLGLGAVAPVPLLARHTEGLLSGKPLRELPLAEACATLRAEIAPIDDLRASAAFRRRVAGNVLAQCLETWIEQLG